MKKLFIPTLLLIASNIAAQTTKTPATKKTAAKPATQQTVNSSAVILKNQVDSLSYAIGVLDGTFFKTQGVSKVNGQMLGRGFSDVINGKPLCSPEVANEIVRREMQKMSQAKVQPNIDKGVKFLEENRKKPGVIVTASGLQYEVIKMGTGSKPTEADTVKVHYDGVLLDGTKFDSSRDRGEPIVYPVTQFIKGWTEALQLMPVGSRFKLYVPYNIGYGIQGSGESIPGGSTLVFDLELIDITSNK